MQEEEEEEEEEQKEEEEERLYNYKTQRLERKFGLRYC